MSADASKTQVVIALIGLAGVLASALVSNWDKIYPSAPQHVTVATLVQPAPAAREPAAPEKSLQQADRPASPARGAGPSPRKPQTAAAPQTAPEQADRLASPARGVSALPEASQAATAPASSPASQLGPTSQPLGVTESRPAPSAVEDRMPPERPVANRPAKPPPRPAAIIQLPAPRPAGPWACRAVVAWPDPAGRLTLSWEPVPGAATYTVEADCFGCAGGRWVSDESAAWHVRTGLGTRSPIYPSRLDVDVRRAGGRAIRWRVWAVDAFGREGARSDWCVYGFRSTTPVADTRGAPFSIDVQETHVAIVNRTGSPIVAGQVTIVTTRGAQLFRASMPPVDADRRVGLRYSQFRAAADGAPFTLGAAAIAEVRIRATDVNRNGYAYTHPHR